MPQWQLLEAARINAIIQGLQDVRELPGQLRFLNRTPVVPTEEGEIMARFVGRAQIADLVADDAQANVYSWDKLNFETTNVPNLKHGRNLTQAMLALLNAIRQNGGLQNDMGIFSQYENRIVNDLLLGVRQRMEALCIAMALDAFTYNRFGIQITGASWGMPSDLKVTPSITWDNPTTATPVTDILTLKRLATVRYGQDFNRATMSLTAFMYLIATTEFQNHARFVLPTGIAPSVLPLQNTEYQRNLAQNILGLQEIELYDARYWTQAASGAVTSVPFLPNNKVIFSSTADDNDPNVTDFANGLTVESMINSLTRTDVIGGFPAPMRGPIAYATAANSQLNPPGITYWSVARGFPRKHKLQATAVMTVGTWSDTITTGVPF